jgi:hypothetical protein
MHKYTHIVNTVIQIYSLETRIIKVFEMLKFAKSVFHVLMYFKYIEIGRLAKLYYTRPVLGRQFS